MGGCAGIKNGGQGRVVMIKTIIIAVKVECLGPVSLGVRLLPESQVLVHS